MKIKKWVKNKIVGLSMSFSNVEKAALNNNGEYSGILDTNQVQRLNQGTLADDLLQGKLTQQVKELRDRTYRVYDKSQEYVTKYDPETGMFVTVKFDDAYIKKILSDFSLDPSDPYELEMVLINDEITLGVNDVLNNIDIKQFEKENDTVNDAVKEEVVDVIIEENESIEETKNIDLFKDIDNPESKIIGEQKTVGVVKGSELFGLKNEKRLRLKRSYPPKIKLENFANKVYIRTIDNETKLIELFFSKFNDGLDSNINILHKEINTAKTNPRHCSSIDIDEIEFITFNTVGSKDFRLFNYKIDKFDKVIEFGGYYLIKFICKVNVNGENILEKYKDEKMEEKYNNKEKKKLTL